VTFVYSNPRVLRVCIKALLVFTSLLSVFSCRDQNTNYQGHAIPPTPIGEVFVSLPAAESIQRVRLADGAILQEIEVGMLPHNFLSSADGKSVYVVLIGSQAVAEVDVETGHVKRTMLTAAVPYKRSDGSLIQGHVDQDASSHTSCYDCHHGGASGIKPTVVGTRPQGISWNTTGDTLLLTNSKTSTIVEIDVQSGLIRKEVSLAPESIAHDPTSLSVSKDFVVATLRPSQPSFEDSVIRVMRSSDYALESETTVGSSANNVFISETINSAFISDFSSNTVIRIPLNGEPLSEIKVQSGPLGVRSVGDSKLLVANYYKNSVSVVNLTDSSRLDIPLQLNGKHYANPTHITLSSDEKFAYIVSTGTQGQVLELDLSSMKLTRVFEIGGLPFDIVMLKNTENSKFDLVRE